MSEADRDNVDDELRRILHESSEGLPARQTGGVVPFRGPIHETRSWLAEPGKKLPNRYEIRETDEGRFVRCKEAPGVGVTIDRAHSFTEAEARKLGERVILLDGVGHFGPLVDDGRHLYNLDHHEGCMRAFTLATCEQALVLVQKGLELDKGDWTIYANEPDLDTLFAMWVLLNYRRVRELRPAARDAIIPLLRLEGSIDANGFEIAEFCGLPQDLVHKERKRLDGLHQKELEKKRTGDWSSTDLLAYAVEMLLEIDQLVYKTSDFADFLSVEKEYDHVDIGQDRVAVVCRDSAGIYEVEKRLKKVWGDRLGIIALEREDGHYTLRRAALLAGIDLKDAYERLNLLDPAVDGRPPQKRWGGSDDIGGSPRPVGTGLTAREIGKILKLTYKQARPWSRVQNLLIATLWVAGLVLLAGLVTFLLRFVDLGVSPVMRSAIELMTFAAVSGVGAFILIRRLSRGWTWLYGWRFPGGGDWYLVIPVVLLAAVAGAVWVPREIGFELEPLLAGGAAVVLSVLALELTFRSLAHGLLVLDSRVQTAGGPWFLSRPTLFSAALYAIVTLLGCWLFFARSPLSLVPLWQWSLLGVAAFAAGVALGVLRERSLSLWPGVVAQFLACALRLGLEVWQWI